MSRVGFVMSGILGIVGFLLLAFGQAAEGLARYVMHMAWQLGDRGSMSSDDWATRLGGLHTVAWVCVGLGVILCLLFYIAGRREAKGAA